jgi:addiction module HigA family antidote
MFELKRQPTHPGVILREEFVEPLGLTQTELASQLRTTFRTVNEILNAKRNVSPDMALRLARFLGTSEELWLNLQDQFDLHKARQKNKSVLKAIKPHRHTVGA